MRTLMMTLLLTFAAVTPLMAAEQAESPQSAALANAERIELGDGVGLPRPVFEQLLAREDGLAMIERMQQRASEAKSFEGVPHLMVVFVGVLLFFWSAMIYYQRKHARLHRTIQHMVEKGVPIPAEILRAAEHFESGSEAVANTRPSMAAVLPPVWASNILWGGLLWLTIGLAGTLFLWLRGSDAWPWGFAAVVYGLGAVLTALAKRRDSLADKS
jgi:hypothetical protein